jgi:hypothetical protein
MDPSAATWTLDDATAFLAIADDDSRLSFIQSLLSVLPEDYRHQIWSTFLVDYHLGNALFCQEVEFSAEQTVFVCESMSALLSSAIAAPAGTNFDQLRLRLIRSLRAMFLARRELFSYAQVQDVLRHVASCLIQPIRLIVWTFQHPPELEPFLELRKVWGPPPLCALDVCERDRFVDPPETLGGGGSEIAAEVDEYWHRLQAQVEGRCRALEEKIRALSERLASEE